VWWGAARLRWELVGEDGVRVCAPLNGHRWRLGFPEAGAPRHGRWMDGLSATAVGDG
jgi:hypothetical protein